MTIFWTMVQRQRSYIAHNQSGDIVAVAYNKGDLHGKQGIDDPTGQRWYGNAMLPNNTWNGYGELDTFSEVSELIENDLR